MSNVPTLAIDVASALSLPAIDGTSSFTSFDINAEFSDTTSQAYKTFAALKTTLAPILAQQQTLQTAINGLNTQRATAAANLATATTALNTFDATADASQKAWAENPTGTFPATDMTARAALTAAIDIAAKEVALLDQVIARRVGEMNALLAQQVSINMELNEAGMLVLQKASYRAAVQYMNAFSTMVDAYQEMLGIEIELQNRRGNREEYRRRIIDIRDPNILKYDAYNIYSHIRPPMMLPPGLPREIEVPRVMSINNGRPTQTRLSRSQIDAVAARIGGTLGAKVDALKTAALSGS